MAKCRVCVALLLLGMAASALLCAAQDAPKEPPSANNNNNTVSASNVTRSERMMKFLKDPKSIGFSHVKHSPLRSRADFALPPLGPPPKQHRLPTVYHRPQGPPRPQVLRRVQNNVAPPGPPAPQRPLRFGYDTPPKAAYYSPLKQGPHYAGAPGYSKAAAGQRPQYANPNALGASPQQLQQQQAQYFKASPHFNGQAIVRPAVAESQQPTGEFLQQHALPQQHTLQQQQPQVFPSSGGGYGVQPTHYQWAYQQEAQQLRQPQAQMYSVYEDPEQREHAALQLNSQQQYGVAAPSSADVAAVQRARDYVKFMNSHEYFLPKRDPNYRQLDAEKDRQQLQQFHYSPVGTGAGSPVAAASFKRPIQVSQTFYQPSPAPDAAIVRGSYQTGKNMFVVNSDGNKAVHHIVASPLPAQLTDTTTPSTAAAANEALQRYSAARRRTPEPVRFEFTENDAIPAAAYTNSPQLRYNPAAVAATTRAPIISSSLGNVAAKHGGSAVTKSGSYGSKKASTTEATALARGDNVIDGDDAEDGDDMHDTPSDNYGRKPPTKGAAASASTTASPPEKQDTEEYCERMCAIVHDDDAEIVCGSDGYMYTSEAQMECYASCLHIDVTIQSKGSCNER